MTILLVSSLLTHNIVDFYDTVRTTPTWQHQPDNIYLIDKTHQTARLTGQHQQDNNHRNDRTTQCTEVRFARFLFGENTTMTLINPLERKLAKRTSVQCGLQWLDNIGPDNWTTPTEQHPLDDTHWTTPSGQYQTDNTNWTTLIRQHPPVNTHYTTPNKQHRQDNIHRTIITGLHPPANTHLTTRTQTFQRDNTNQTTHTEQHTPWHTKQTKMTRQHQQNNSNQTTSTRQYLPDNTNWTTTTRNKPQTKHIVWFDILGTRSPFLQSGGDEMYQMMMDKGFEYDCSAPSQLFGYQNLAYGRWPYTYDYYRLFWRIFVFTFLNFRSIFLFKGLFFIFFANFSRDL